MRLTPISIGNGNNSSTQTGFEKACNLTNICKGLVAADAIGLGAIMSKGRVGMFVGEWRVYQRERQ